jgi:hypothetical protein
MFERSIEQWQALGATRDLYDVAAAARCWRRTAPAGQRLDSPALYQFRDAEVHLTQLAAHRWWRQARPAFLAEVGALTAAERAFLERAEARVHEREER